MLNISYWEKLTFSNLRFSRRENLKKCTSFEVQKGTKHIRENVNFGIIVLNCLSSTNLCIRFLLICFAREIKGFYQSSLGNEVDFTHVMNVSQISWLKIKISKNWDMYFVDERAMVTTTLTSYCHWKTLVPFCFRKKKPEKAFVTLTVNYRKIAQKNYAIQNNSKLDISLYMTLCFDWKIGVFQQTVVRIYYIFNETFIAVRCICNPHFKWFKSCANS